MLTRRYALVGLGLVVLIVLSTPSTVVAAKDVGKGGISRFKGVQVVGLPDFACTSSLKFRRMPRMSVKFSLEEESRVVAQFQGQFGGFESTANTRVVIRITIDGITVGSAIAVGDDPGIDLHTFGFNVFSSPLAPGSHKAKVLWHIFPSGERSCVEERSLILLLP